MESVKKIVPKIRPYNEHNCKILIIYSISYIKEWFIDF